jgi:starvation-inducible DNA-binding protein
VNELPTAVFAVGSIEESEMTKNYPTKNDLSESLRREMIALLNRSLATAVDLALQSKQAHWNVKGPNFYSLHQLFDQVYGQATEWVDEIAERAVQLGGVAEATLDVVGKRTELPGYALDLATGRDHVDAVSRALAVFGKSVRAGVDSAAKAGDVDTSDLFTEVSRGVDKMLWFVEAHLQADR